MNSQTWTTAPARGGFLRGHLIAVLGILLFGSLAHSAGDPLKGQFVQKLRSIVETSDAVVGVAIKNLTTGEKIFINENEVFPQASCIKIHILAELYHQAEQGTLRLSDVLPLLIPT